MIFSIINFPVKVQKFKEHNVLKETLLTAINEQKEVEHLIGPNNDITRCDWQPARFNTNRRWVKDIRDPLSQHIAKWAESFGYANFKVLEIWFQQYAQNSKHSWHTHGGNFTCVYYLDLPKDTPRTQWINPTNLSEETFDVAEGDIIIFPSWLIHRAPQNKSKEMKTIISWNIEVGISDFYGEDQ